MKAPSFPFYVRDWLCDTELSRCSPATRGIWMDMLAQMWLAPARGELSCVDMQTVCRMCRCSPEEARHAVVELASSGTADVEILPEAGADARRRARKSASLDRHTVTRADRNVTLNVTSTVTIRCRRMAREQAARNYAASRQKRHRAKAACSSSPPDHGISNAPCHKKVTRPSAFASSFASAKKNIASAQGSSVEGAGLQTEDSKRLAEIFSESPDSLIAEIAIGWSELLWPGRDRRSDAQDQADMRDLLAIAGKLAKGLLGGEAAGKALDTLAHELGRSASVKNPIAAFKAEVRKMEILQCRKGA